MYTEGCHLRCSTTSILDEVRYTDGIPRLDEAGYRRGNFKGVIIQRAKRELLQFVIIRVIIPERGSWINREVSYVIKRADKSRVYA